MRAPCRCVLFGFCDILDNVKSHILKQQLWYYCRWYILHIPINYIHFNFIISLWSSLSNEQLSIFAVIISQLWYETLQLQGLFCKITLHFHLCVCCRNLSACGGPEVCEDMVRQDALTPLSALLREVRMLDQFNSKALLAWQSLTWFFNMMFNVKND